MLNISAITAICEIFVLLGKSHTHTYIYMKNMLNICSLRKCLYKWEKTHYCKEKYNCKKIIITCRRHPN